MPEAEQCFWSFVPRAPGVGTRFRTMAGHRVLIHHIMVSHSNSKTKRKFFFVCVTLSRSIFMSQSSAFVLSFGLSMLKSLEIFNKDIFLWEVMEGQR